MPPALFVGTHHFESLDGRVGSLHRLETSHWTNQLFQLAMIGFDDIVQIFELSMHLIQTTLAFNLQF